MFLMLASLFIRVVLDVIKIVFYMSFKRYILHTTARYFSSSWATTVNPIDNVLILISLTSGGFFDMWLLLTVVILLYIPVQSQQ